MCEYTMTDIKVTDTAVICFLYVYDGTGNWLALCGQDATLDVHMLSTTLGCNRTAMFDWGQC